MKRVFLGIDTSNYTTSCALADEIGKVLVNLKLPLSVAEGERGLRQSDAVFQHTHAVPELIERLKNEIASAGDGLNICAVGYSSSPRDVEGSYMPCFLVGEAIARSIAFGANAPVYSFSHQSGHIMAALYSADVLSLIDAEFAAFHVSGGTTEAVFVSPDPDRIFSVEKIGGTLDLSAGQLIDRIGVKTGFPFPCGKYVDECACGYSGEKDAVRVRVNDMYCNISGAENQAMGIYEKYNDKGRTCAFVLEFISRTLLKISGQIRERWPDIPILYAGGVMSSLYIKERLKVMNGYHASPEYSSDNAAGVALLTREKHRRITRDEQPV